MRCSERHSQNLYCVIYSRRCKSLALQGIAVRADVGWCDLAQQAISLHANMGEKIADDLIVF